MSHIGETMNDKDKEAFKKWMQYEDRHDGVFGNNNNFTRDEWIADKAWQAACEYKQEEYLNLMEAMTQTSQYNFKLQAENAKLKKFISVLGHDDQVVDDVIESLEKLEKMEYE